MISHFDQFKSLAGHEKTLSFKTSDQVISEFKITANNYAKLVGQAVTGDIHALVALAASDYEKGKNREEALAVFEAAIDAAALLKQDSGALGELACAIATILKERDLKAKYYHRAILAGNKKAFLELCSTFPKDNLTQYILGDYYALFALNLLEENLRQAYIEKFTYVSNSWQTLFDKNNCFAIYQDFYKKNPKQFKVFFRQHSVEELKRALCDETIFTQDLFNKYQDELVDNILNYIGKLDVIRPIYGDNIQKAKLFYQDLYHPSYFEGIEFKIANKIEIIEKEQIPGLLYAMKSDVNQYIKELMIELVDLFWNQKSPFISSDGADLTGLESDFYSQILQASQFLLFTRDQQNDDGNYQIFSEIAYNENLVSSFSSFLQSKTTMLELDKKDSHQINTSKVKDIFFQLKALEKTKNILYADAPGETIILSAAPSAPLESAVGPQGGAVEMKSDRSNNVISIANTKKYITAINALHTANNDVLRVCNQPLKPWTSGVFMSFEAVLTMTFLGSPGWFGLGGLVLGLAALNTPQAVSLGVLLTCAASASSLILLAGLIYAIGNYVHPVGVAVREEKKSALQALSLFKDKMFKESAAIAAAPTVPTVRPYLQAS